MKLNQIKNNRIF
jgi:hypothetical protein